MPEGSFTPHCETKIRRPAITRPVVRQVSLSLIRAELDRHLREGRLSKGAALAARDPSHNTSSIEALSIDEDGLGFDSLSRIDLVTATSTFFGLAESGVDDYLMIRRTVGEWVDLVEEHIRRTDPSVRLTFSTSGSTGRPKRVSHRLDSLKEEMRAQCEVVEDRTGHGLPERVTCLVPQHHIFGFLFGALLPDLQGIASIDLEGRSTTAILNRVRPGDLIVATPFLLERLAEAGDGLPRGVSVVMSAGPSTRRPGTRSSTLHLNE